MLTCLVMFICFFKSQNILYTYTSYILVLFARKLEFSCCTDFKAIVGNGFKQTKVFHSTE